MNSNALPLKDIKPLILLDDRWPWWQWLLVVCALILVGWLLFRWLRNRGKPKAAIKPLPKPIDPFAHFYSQLEALDQLLGQPTEYCFELSRLLREFIENRYGFRATDRTSEEILVEIRRLYAFSEKELTGLRDFFNRVDPVRYAKKLPEESELLELKQEIVTLVNNHNRQRETKELSA